MKRLLSQFDRQDLFSVLGLALWHYGLWSIFHPAALISGGVFCFAFVVFLERERAAAIKESAATPKRPRLVIEED